MMELVSIVMPVYNAQAYLKESVGSVQSQTYENWELIAVDDCSSDSSCSILEEMAGRDARIRLIRPGQKLGAARARNKGIDEAKGRFLAFLDADDIWQSEKLQRELAFLRQKQAVFVFTGYEFGDEDGKGVGKVVHVPETLTYRQALSRTVIFTTTVLFDMQRLDRKLLYMPDVKSEDTATWWNILRSGVTAYGLDENLAVYRRPAKSLSSNKLEAIRRIWRLYRGQERLSIPVSVRCFCLWAVRAVARRV